MFRVGQKVVCVREPCPGHERRFAYPDEQIPKFGSVYTIRDALMIQGESCPQYRLQEIVNPVYRYSQGAMECTYPHAAFRPVIERKTDISCFTQILDKVNKRETVKCP
jgi:hypothetical protein